MMRTALRSLGLLTPAGVEKDPDFAFQTERLTQRALRVAAAIGVSGDLFAMGIQALLRPSSRFAWSLDADPYTFTLWAHLACFALAALLIYSSFTRFGARHGRLISAISFTVIAVLIPIDWLAAGENHPAGYGVQALVMLLAVGTLPYRAWQTAIIGAMMAILFMLTALLVPQAFDRNPAVIFPEFPAFMLVLTVVCCGVSALLYRSRYELYRGQKEAERLHAQIEQSEQEYRALFENSSDGIFVYSDEQGGFIRTNSVLRQLLGMDEAELRHTHFSKVIHPDDLERVVQIHTARIRGEPAPNRYALKVRNPGSTEPIICEMTIHRSENRLYTMGALRDITEHVRMEEEIKQLAQLAETNPFPVLRFDRDGRVLYLNPAARRYPADLGHPDLTISDFLPEDFKSLVRQLVDTNTTVIDGRIEVRNHVFSVTYRPLPEVQQLYVWLIDVTERIRAEERVRAYATELEAMNRELRETQAQLVQSEKMAALGSLVAGVAHEINTPLGSIHANADVSRRAMRIINDSLAGAKPCVSPPESERFMTALRVLEDANATTRTASERIVGIVRSLRNFARLDEAELKTVDIHEGLESTLTLAYHEYKNRITIVREYGEVPPVTCFPNQLNQVFMNLIVNAVHAIPNEGTITITTRTLDQHFYVAISDTGIGIPEGNLSRIFDPGFTTKGVGVGTGLGLSIVYKIIQAHGGRIDVQSRVGEGTTFTITCPIAVPTTQSLGSK